MKFKKLLAFALGVCTLSLPVPLQVNAEISYNDYMEVEDFPYIAYHILNDHVEVTKNPKIVELERIIQEATNYTIDENGNFVWYNGMGYEELKSYVVK